MTCRECNYCLAPNLHFLISRYLHSLPISLWRSNALSRPHHKWRRLWQIQAEWVCRLNMFLHRRCRCVKWTLDFSTWRKIPWSIVWIKVKLFLSCLFWIMLLSGKSWDVRSAIWCKRHNADNPFANIILFVDSLVPAYGSIRKIKITRVRPDREIWVSTGP